MLFSFRAARADDAPVDSSVPSPKKTKSLKAHSHAQAVSERDESVTCGELSLCVCVYDTLIVPLHC